MAESDGWSADVVAAVRKFALQNALEYDGSGQAGSVLGRLLSEKPDLRPEAKRLMEIVAYEVSAANALAQADGLDAVRAELEQSAPGCSGKREASKGRGVEGIARRYLSGSPQILTQSERPTISWSLSRSGNQLRVRKDV